VVPVFAGVQIEHGLHGVRDGLDDGRQRDQDEEHGHVLPQEGDGDVDNARQDGHRNRRALAAAQPRNDSGRQEGADDAGHGDDDEPDVHHAEAVENVAALIDEQEIEQRVARAADHLADEDRQRRLVHDEALDHLADAHARHLLVRLRALLREGLGDLQQDQHADQRQRAEDELCAEEAEVFVLAADPGDKRHEDQRVEREAHVAARVGAAVVGVDLLGVALRHALK